MKRDMNLIRRIVLAVEALPDGEALQELTGVPAFDLAAHAVWLKEAGLVQGQAMAGTGSFATVTHLQRLTWEGADFADAIRNESLWKRAVEKVLHSGASFTFEVLRDALKAEILQGFPSLR